MILGEVKIMEEIRENENLTEEPKETYVPRPVWQLWAARAALVLVLLFVAYQILSIATGGK